MPRSRAARTRIRRAREQPRSRSGRSRGAHLRRERMGRAGSRRPVHRAQPRRRPPTRGRAGTARSDPARSSSMTAEPTHPVAPVTKTLRRSHKPCSGAECRNRRRVSAPTWEWPYFTSHSAIGLTIRRAVKWSRSFTRNSISSKSSLWAPNRFQRGQCALAGGSVERFASKIGSVPKVFSRRTLGEFEDASASIPLRQLVRAFERADSPG